MIYLIIFAFFILGALSSYYKKVDIIVLSVAFIAVNFSFAAFEELFPTAPIYSYWDVLPMSIWVLENGPRALVNTISISPIVYFIGKISAGMICIKNRLSQS